MKVQPWNRVWRFQLCYWWKVDNSSIAPDWIVDAIIFYFIFSSIKCFEPHENEQKLFWIMDPSDSGILAGSLPFLTKFWQGNGKRSWQDLCHFYRNFGKVMERIESDMKGVHNRNELQYDKWCVFLILVRIWIQIKRWLGSWNRSAHEHFFC